MFVWSLKNSLYCIVLLNPLAVTPFLKMGVKMHCSNINGCNIRMLWDIYPKFGLVLKKTLSRLLLK